MQGRDAAANRQESWQEIAERLDAQAARMLETLEGVKGNVYLYRIGELSATAAILAVEEELDHLAAEAKS